MSRLRIGYVGPEKKWESLKWDKFIEYATKRNIDVVHINLDEDFDKQGKFDIIIHKVTYLMSSPYIEENPKIKNLYEFSKKHPEVILIDNLQSVGKTLDRKLLDQAMRSIQWPDDIIVKIPKAKMLEKSDIESIINSSKELRFPILAKPKSSCQTATSTNEEAHTFRIAAKPEDLVGFPTPSLLQEYINHGGIVYKIYTIGDHLEVTARPSTRDLMENEMISVDFHSQKPDVENGIWANYQISKNENFPIEDFKKISKAIRSTLKMELIGFDILIDSNGSYWIVDINSFPGYKMIPNLPELFYEFFVNLVKK